MDIVEQLRKSCAGKSILACTKERRKAAAAIERLRAEEGYLREVILALKAENEEELRSHEHLRDAYLKLLDQQS